MAVLEQMFPWAMSNTSRNYVRPAPHLITGPFRIGDLSITPVPVVHPSVETFGFRFDLPTGHSLAYLSDVKDIPSSSLSLLEGLEVLIIDALRPRPHPTHMNVEESLSAIARIQPARALLTHLAHEIDCRNADTELGLPDTVSLARDGLRLGFESSEPCAIVSPPDP